MKKKNPAWQVILGEISTHQNLWIMYINQICKTGSPYDTVANVLDCNIIVSKFKLQSCYYVHFQINNIGKDMSPLILPAVHLQGWLWHWITHKGWYAIKQRNESKSVKISTLRWFSLLSKENVGEPFLSSLPQVKFRIFWLMGVPLNFCN